MDEHRQRHQRRWLSSLDLEVLRERAAQQGVAASATTDREALIESLLLADAMPSEEQSAGTVLVVGHESPSAPQLVVEGPAADVGAQLRADEELARRLAEENPDASSAGGYRANTQPHAETVAAEVAGSMSLDAQMRADEQLARRLVRLRTPETTDTDAALAERLQAEAVVCDEEYRRTEDRCRRLQAESRTVAAGAARPSPARTRRRGAGRSSGSDGSGSDGSGSDGNWEPNDLEGGEWETDNLEGDEFGVAFALPGANAATVDSTTAKTAFSAAGDASAAEKQCSICIEDFKSGEQLRTLPCLHRFHAACIDPWLAQSRTCPICKHDIAG